METGRRIGRLGGAADYVIKKQIQIDLPRIIEKLNQTSKVNGIKK